MFLMEGFHLSSMRIGGRPAEEPKSAPLWLVLPVFAVSSGSAKSHQFGQTTARPVLI